MSNSLKLTSLVVSLFFALTVVTPAHAVDDPGASVILDFADTGIKDVLNAEIEPQEQLTRWNDLFVGFFDIPTISRFVAGRHWRRASNEDREAFVDVFRQYIVYTWYRRFDLYTGQTLEVLETAPDGENGVVVTTSMEAGGNQAFEIQWRLRNRDDGMKIVDIIVEGVSMALTYRQEYASVIKRTGGGIPGLTGELSKEIDELSSEFGQL